MNKIFFIISVLTFSNITFANSGCLDIQGYEIHCPLPDKTTYQIMFEEAISAFDNSSKQKYISDYSQFFAKNYIANSAKQSLSIESVLSKEIADITINDSGKPSLFNSHKLNSFLKQNPEINNIYQLYLLRKKMSLDAYGETQVVSTKKSTFKQIILDEINFPIYKLYVQNNRANPLILVYLSKKLNDYDYKNLLNWFNHGDSPMTLHLGVALAIHSFNNTQIH